MSTTPVTESKPDADARLQFEELVQGLDVIVWEMDVESWRFTFVSERAEHILGYPTHRWLGDSAFWQETLLHPEDRAWALDFCRSATHAARDHAFEYRAVHADGHVVWLHDLVRVVRDEQGRARRLRGVMIDVSEKKLAQEKLREREAQLAEAQAIAGLGSWDWDVVADRITWSDEQFRLHGREPLPQVDYEWFFSHIHPDDQGWLGAWMERVLVTGDAFEFPYRIIRPDGEVRWLFARGKMKMSDDGRPLRMFGTSQDITERRLFEDTLRASEESYRTIFELAGDAMFVHDPQTGDVLDANRRACELHGCTLEELRADGLSILSGNQDAFSREQARQLIRRAAAGEPQRFEWQVHNRDGSDVWVEVDLNRVTIRGETRVLAGVRNINERKAAEARLRASEESYRAIFELSNDAIFVHDIETGAILDANRKAAELSGRSVEELKAHGVALFSNGPEPFTHERAMERIQRAAAGEPQRFEWLSYTPAGPALWAEVSLQRVTIAGVDRLLATTRDITERKLAEEALREAERHAQDMASRMHAVADAAAGVIGADSVSALVPVLREACREVISFDAFVLALYDEANHTLAYAEGYDANVYVPADLISAAGTPAERVICERRSLVTHRASDPEAAGSIPMGTGRRSESIIRTPVLSGDRVLGVLSVQSYTPELYTEQDVEVLEAIASLTATALLNLELLGERRAAEEALRRVNEELEQRVAERTAELEASNAALEEEVAEHEAARAELLQRTEELEGIFQALPDLYFRLAADGTILDHRAGSADDLYLPPEAFLGRRMQDLLPPDAGAGIREALAEVESTGRLVCAEYALPIHDQVCEYEARLLPLEDGSLISMVRNITDRKQAERELQQSEERFRRLTENSSDLVQIIDANGQVGYTGPSVRHLLGYTPGELAGASALEFVHPDDLPRVIETFRAVAATPGTSYSAQYRIRHKDGRWRVFEAFGRTLLPDSAEQGVVVNARDVTERHEAEEALRASEARYRALIENAHDVVTITDTSGVIHYQSPQLRRVLGFEPEEMIGRSALDFVHPDDRPLTEQVFQELIASPGATTHNEYRFIHKDGTWRYLETYGRTLLPDVAESGLVFNTRDVTERREAEAALRRSMQEAERAREAAERANRAKSEFLSRMSHELRTPMNSILGFAQLLERAPLPAEQRKGVQHILKAGRHLLQLINEVLEIARIEAGRQNLSLEPVRVATVLQEAVGLVRPLAAQWHVELDEGPCPCGERYVQADRQRLTQVLLNLLANAIKYNRAGGRVRLSCERIERAGSRTRLAIRIEDTGRGIAPEKAEQLFTPFARLGAEQTEVEGTGLGLALSQRLTEAMGGGLCLESTGSEGSVFRLELLLTADPLQRLDPPAEPAVSRGEVAHAHAKLLYIEDNLANLSLVETILLSRPKWQTLPALQGQIGVELAREHTPDLILLDLHLPDIPGREVLRRLRAEPRTARIPVVVITADATRGAIEQLQAAGADAYLTKPLDIDQFLATVERFLPQDGREEGRGKREE